jgi:hypothetical protein
MQMLVTAAEQVQIMSLIQDHIVNPSIWRFFSPFP